MIPASERGRARHVFTTSTRLRDELRIGVEEMGALGPLSPERIEAFTPADRRVVLAFLKRFENAVEAGRRLFRAALLLAAVDVLDMSTFDMLASAEREGVLRSAAGWRDVMRVRNVVAHEYAMTPEEAAAALENALRSAGSAAGDLDQALALLARPPYATWMGEPEP